MIPISLDNDISIRIRSKGCRGEELKEEPARWALARWMPTVGPCQQDRKAESTEILLALPNLRVLGRARRSSSAPGTWRGPGTPELTVGADVSGDAQRSCRCHRRHNSSQTQEATALRTGNPSQRVGTSGARPQLCFFRNELLDRLIS